MKTILHRKHPCLMHHEIVSQVCQPLEKLAVNFFGYTAVDIQGRAFCLGSKVQYAEQYLLRQHAKVDIHRHHQDGINKINYFFWDFASLNEEEKAIYDLARQHNQAHTLSITKKTANMIHCYHFSGDIHDETINQRFLHDLDFLHTFMDYFDDCLINIPEITSIYEHPTNIEQPTFASEFVIVGQNPKALNFEHATSHVRFKNFAEYCLTANERRCLYWLQRGKSMPIIAEIMDVSKKTIERRVAEIKRKYECYTLYQLGQKVSERGLSQLLDAAS